MPRTTTVHLLQGDYPDRLARLQEAAKAALEDTSPNTALEGHPYQSIADEYQALKAEAIAKGVTVNLAALGRSTWRRLKEKHPPRVGDDFDPEVVANDRLAGVNTDSVEDDLVFESMRAWQDEAGESPQSRSAFDEWVDKRSEGEWQVLVMRAWELTNGARLDPKDLPALPTRSDG